MTTRRHEEHELNRAAYLLGALTDLECEVFERHLMGCRDCREGLEQLKPALAALPRSVEPLEPPPELRAKLLERLEREGREAVTAKRPGRTSARSEVESVLARDRRGGDRRRRGGTRRSLGNLLRPRTALAGGLAALALAGGVGLGFALDEPPARAPTGGKQVLSASVDRSRVSGASGSLVRPVRSDEAALLRVQGLEDPGDSRVYQVWLRRGDETIPATVFAVRGDGSAEAAIVDDLDDADAVLVTREHSGGARKPTEEPIVSVRTS